jgi:hypothetical protein
MSNPQTTQQWTQAAVAIDAQINQIEQLIDTAAQQQLRNSSQILQLRQQLNSLPAGSAARAEVDQQMIALSDQNNQLTADQAQLVARLSPLEISLNNATNQATASSSGPPNTSVVPPPALPPNADATDVPPPAPLPQVTSEPGAVDPNPSAVITPGTDGVANVDITGGPANVNPNSDPFEQARFEAEQAANVPPNEIVLTPDEQAAANDPFEQRRLELEQEANREELAREENLSVGDSDPITFPPSPDFAFNPEAEEERTNLNAAIKQGTLDKARAQNTIANQRRNPNNGDWRVKLRLAPGSNYLYNAPGAAGILQPVAAQGGVIFPYTPTIQTTYKATYSSYDLTHSNYKGYYYQGSQVEPVTLSCPFTAQSTIEAEYLLAVIHFFKSVTKMFYGQDPERGTPPPLVYLTGLGEFQFNEHPCVVQSFTYELPADVDYIRARSQNVNNSNMLNKRQSTNATGPGTTWGNGVLGNFLGGAINRLANAGIPKAAMNTPPPPASFGQNSPTYVPTKMTIAISLLPVQSRRQQSQQFSLRQYANGDLLKGGFW